MASPLKPAPPMAHPSQFPVLQGKADPDVVRQISLLSQQNRQLQSKLDALQQQHRALANAADQLYGPRAIKQAIELGGSHALNAQGLIGQLSQGQLTDVVQVTALPDINSPYSQDGNVVELTTTGAKYIWRNSPAPGGWVLFVGPGGGGVTSFSAGNFNPLFTTSVATPTTTPALSFVAVAAANGQVPIGNGTGFVAATLTAGAGMTITNGAGTITIAATGTGLNFSDQETPSGTINGVNTTFTLAHTPSPAASLLLFENGLVQKAGGADYTLAGATITYGVAPPTGTVLLVWYRY